MEGELSFPSEMKYKYWSSKGDEEGLCEESCYCLYPPLTSENKKEDWSHCVKVVLFWVIIIQIFVHIIACIVSDNSVGVFLAPDFNITLMNFGAFQSERVFKKYEYWRLITTCFLHSDLIHLWSNVFPQIFFCLGLSRSWGWKIIIPIYMIPGIVATTMTSMLKPLSMGGVGASGNTYGMAGAYSIMIYFFWEKIPKNQIFSVLSWPIYFFIWLGIYQLMPGAGNWTHTFGLIAGALIATIYFVHNKTTGILTKNFQIGSGTLLIAMFIIPIIYHL